MLYPSINEIKHKADSRYTLVILAAKRARDLVDGKPPLVDCKVNRPVSIAAREINEDLIKVRYPEDKPEEPEEDEAAEAAVAEEGEEAEAAESEDAEAAEPEEPVEEAEADEAEEAAEEAEAADEQPEDEE